MLKGITWGQFGIFILVVTGSYYLYVGVRFYKSEVLGLFRKGKQNLSGGNNNVPGGAGDPSKGESEPKAAANQAELFGSGNPAHGGDVQFQLTQRAIGVIRQVIARGIESKLDRENLLDHIREVLGDYRQLRKTEYAETINQFLVRVCSSELSMEVGEQELAALWK
ncbi:MAG TPA: hypothetical protein VGM30_19615 [Puia sp.]